MHETWTDKPEDIGPPPGATLPLNRCNVPANILGSLSYQVFPIPLELDGLAEVHASFWALLEEEKALKHRMEHFRRYMTATFRLDHPEEVGLTNPEEGRAKADYLWLLRGWLFDPNGQEAAVLKGWVESRFGLTPRHHGAPMHDTGEQDGLEYRSFLKSWAEGLYATDSLEAQLDLVYGFTQQELRRAYPSLDTLTLYRGVNRLEDFEILKRPSKTKAVALLNNLNSFSSSRERAGEFGDYILTAQVPLSKIFAGAGFFPGSLKGENEALVIGGVYAMDVAIL